MGFISSSQLKEVEQTLVNNLKTGTLVPAKSLLTDNFDTKMVLNDQSAYNFRPTATMGSMSLEVGSPCKEKAVIGGSLGWNQVAKELNNTNYATLNATVTYNNNVATFLASEQYGGIRDRNMSGLKDHIYYFNANLTSNIAVRIRNTNSSSNQYITLSVFKANFDFDELRFLDSRASDWTTEIVGNVQFIDLTVCFGSTIANYIYSLETATAGAGVAWFKRYFPKPYYPYKAIGDFTSVVTKGKKRTGFNQWDEQWEVGKYDTSGNPATATNCMRSKSTDPIKVEPSTVYYCKAGTLSTLELAILFYDCDDNYISLVGAGNTTFTTPSNACYVRFFCGTVYGSTYKNDICINFHYDGERDGEYEAYQEDTVAVDPIEIIGIPKLDSNGNLYYDGDTYSYDGTITRTVGLVDWSTIPLVQWSAEEYVTAKRFQGLATSSTANLMHNIPTSLCRKIEILGADEEYPDRIHICFAAGHFQDTIAAARAALAPYQLVAKLLPSYYTTETAATFQEIQDVDNWGTEEWLPPENDTRPVEVPVGHDTDYLPDYKAKIEVAADMPAENGVYVLEHDDTNEDNPNQFTPIANWLATNGYTKLSDLTAEDFGTITSTELIENAFYKNVIEIVDNISAGDIVFVVGDNEKVYPCQNDGTNLIVYCDQDFSTDNVSINRGFIIGSENA